jgi:hypothetical protein
MQNHVIQAGLLNRGRYVLGGTMQKRIQHVVR